MSFKKLVLACLLVSAVTLPSTVVASASGGSDRPGVTVPAIAATDITPTSAKLAAIIEPHVLSSMHLEIGPTTSYGYKTTERAVAYLVPVQVWTTVTGFAPATTYHFRYVVSNIFGTTNGPDRSFTTAAAPAETQPPAPEVTPPLAEVPPPAPATPPVTPIDVPAVAPPVSVTDTPPATAGDATHALGASGSAPVLLPQESKTVVAEEVDGNVTIRKPGSDSFVSPSAAGEIPVGSVIDARSGTIELHANTGNGIDKGRFWGGIFEVRQPRGGHGVTELVLRGEDRSHCKTAGAHGARATAARKRKVGGLWGKDNHGRFRTRGRNSVATVRGTEWYVAERCAGTLTRVAKGAVSVLDRHTGRSVVVHAGEHVMVRRHGGFASRRPIRG